MKCLDLGAVDYGQRVGAKLRDRRSMAPSEGGEGAFRGSQFSEHGPRSLCFFFIIEAHRDPGHDAMALEVAPTTNVSRYLWLGLMANFMRGTNFCFNHCESRFSDRVSG